MVSSKVYAAAVIAGFLLPASLAVPPWRGVAGGYYWPILDYPMYSTAHHAGEAVLRYELRVRSCRDDTQVLPMPARTVGIELFAFERMLADVRTARASAARSKARLDAALRRVVPPDFCRAEIWEQRYVITTEGLRSFDPPWRFASAWTIAPADEPVGGAGERGAIEGTAGRRPPAGGPARLLSRRDLGAALRDHDGGTTELRSALAVRERLDDRDGGAAGRRRVRRRAMTRLLEKLDRHWFAPASRRDLGIVRMAVFGSHLLLFLPPLARSLQWPSMPGSLFHPLAVLRAMMLPLGGGRPTVPIVLLAYVVAVLAGAGATLGWRTRLSTFAAAAANTFLSAHKYSYGDVHHNEALMILVEWVLVFGPSGAGWSVDALRHRLRGARERGTFVPAPPGEDLHFEARWPLRLAQWLVVSVYLSAAVAKLSHGGLAWVNGYTLAYHFTNDGVRWHKTLPMLLAGMPRLLAALSILAVTLEATFVLAIVAPRLARLYVLGGALMHTSMWFIQRAPFFQYFFVYLVFIESLRRYWPLARAAARAAHAPRWTLVYDGLCPVCVRTMTVLDFLDGRRRLRFVDLAGDWTRVATVAPALTPEQASAAMHLLGSSGEVYRGFFAFRRLARELPPLWVLLPVLHLPGAGTIGPMVYDYVARNRSHAPCRAEVCTV